MSRFRLNSIDIVLLCPEARTSRNNPLSRAKKFSDDKSKAYWTFVLVKGTRA